MTNSPSIIPVLTYADPARAIRFLEEAFGFTTMFSVPGEDGGIVHAELRYGDGLVAIGGPTKDRLSLTYIPVEDVAGHCERARAAGATITMEPTTMDYGSTEYMAEDFAGNQWSFGTYRPSLGD
ncbi:VOC family protein [Sciscionella sediminilitoris]|uniref:VOC family protein n=1 Tax=Sciscionella sediminilitoris TaxID=1445613 RepID=UPI0004DF1BBC|nr:VOC family protein [Sciscionella sp. SE31]